MIAMKPLFWRIALGLVMGVLAITSALAESHEQSVGETISETSRDVVDATKEGYESTKEWVTETSSDIADATKEGYEDAKQGTKDLVEDVKKGYNKKDG